MYSQTQYEVLLTPTAASGGTAQPGNLWTAGLLPHIIRGFALTVVTSPVAAAVVNLLQQSYASGAAATTIATLNLNAAELIGTTVFVDNLNAEVKPGERIFMVLPVAIAGLTFVAAIIVEPRWERPENLPLMRKSD